MTSPEEHGKRIHVTTSVLADNVPGYTDWSGKRALDGHVIDSQKCLY